MLSEVPVGSEIKKEEVQRGQRENRNVKKKKEEAVGGWAGERGKTKRDIFSVKILHPQKVKKRQLASIHIFLSV